MAKRRLVKPKRRCCKSNPRCKKCPVVCKRLSTRGLATKRKDGRYELLDIMRKADLKAARAR